MPQPPSPGVVLAWVLLALLGVDAGQWAIAPGVTPVRLAGAALVGWTAWDTARGVVAVPRGLTGAALAFAGAVALSSVDAVDPRGALSVAVIVAAQAASAVALAAQLARVTPETLARGLGIGALGVAAPVLVDALTMPRPDDPVKAAWKARASGLFVDPNLAVAALLATWPFAAAALRRVEGSGGLHVAVLALPPVAILATHGRAGAAVAAAVTLGLIVLLHAWPARLGLAAAAGAVATAATVDLGAIGLRARTLVDPGLERALGHASLDQRAALHQIAWDTFRAHPVNGLGAGQFPAAAVDRVPHHVPKMPHDTWLGLAAETGVMGLLGAAFVGLALLAAVRAGLGDPARRDLAVGAVLTGLALATFALTIDLWMRPVAWAAVGVVAATVTLHPPPPPR